MSSVITARVDDDVIALVDRVAKANGRSRAWFAARAIEAAARQEAEFLAFVQEGLDDFERGDVVSHGEMEAWFDARIAAHLARCD